MIEVQCDDQIVTGTPLCSKEHSTLSMQNTKGQIEMEIC